MAVQDDIFQRIKELQERYPDGISAQDLAGHIGIKRSTASYYLNALAEEGQLGKSRERPVRFFLQGDEKAAPIVSVLDSLVGAQYGLREAIELCKSAVLYPPDGLSLLISGNSGTGKSFLAAKLYEYAIEQGVIPADAKYVELNCADYASNPQLLSSVLFGHVKGAYTGAEAGREGLVAQADRGYLFLDEVHRLSHENQEKLFLLMDQGRYRMLGENSGWHTARIRFLFATTEDPDDVLLKTLLRRIVIRVSLPDWSERSLWERLQIIRLAYQEEAGRLERDFILPAETVASFLRYQSAGNIGSVRNAIRISCAQAYKDAPDRRELTVTFPVLERGKNVQQLNSPVPELHIRQSDVWAASIHIPLSFAQETRALAARLEMEDYAAVEIDAQRLLQRMRAAGVECFPGYNDAECRDPQLRQCRAFARTVTERLKRTCGLREDKLEQDFLLLFLFDMFDGFSFTEEETNILTARAEEFHRRAGRLTVEFLKSLREDTQLNDGFQRFFLPLLLSPAFMKTPLVAAAVACRGETAAADIAGIANRICGGYIYDGLRVDTGADGVKETVDVIRGFLARTDISGGFLLLVDQDDLDELYRLLRPYLRGNLAIAGNVSPNLAIRLGQLLHEENDFTAFKTRAVECSGCPLCFYEKGRSGDRLIVSCISGIGIAGKIADIFRKKIGDSGLEITTMDYRTLTRLLERGDEEGGLDASLVITINDIFSDAVPILSVSMLSERKGLALLRQQLGGHLDDVAINAIVRELGMLFSVEGMAASLRFLDPHKIAADVENCIEAYESCWGVVFTTSLRMNLSLHISLMVERLMFRGDGETGGTDETEVNAPKEFVARSVEILVPLAEKYNVIIPEEEIGMLYEMLKYELE